MKKHGGAIVFVVLLIVVGFFSFKDELHIDIKNPFAGKSEVPDSVVEEMLAETTDSIGYSADEVTYTWEAKHTPDREQHQDTVELTLVCSGEYGAVTFKRAQTYQYYKENDIWDVCESGDLETTDIQYNSPPVSGAARTPPPTNSIGKQCVRADAPACLPPAPHPM